MEVRGYYETPITTYKEWNCVIQILEKGIKLYR